MVLKLLVDSLSNSSINRSTMTMNTGPADCGGREEVVPCGGSPMTAASDELRWSARPTRGVSQFILAHNSPASGRSGWRKPRCFLP